MSDDRELGKLLELYQESMHDFRTFMNGVVLYLGDHPSLSSPKSPLIHSYKSRLKDIDHLRAKIQRKRLEGRDINKDNLFSQITDLAGVRILLLYQANFGAVNSVIQKKITDGDWVLGEKPKAYTWDPESVEFFRGFNLDVIEKSTSYTSVHYLIRPRAGSPICCEVQVRTLFEEIWGEVDHQINYPEKTSSIACAEQIKVLSKLVGAGSRLLDSLQRIQQSDSHG